MLSLFRAFVIDVNLLAEKVQTLKMNQSDLQKIRVRSELPAALTDGPPKRG